MYSLELWICVLRARPFVGSHSSHSQFAAHRPVWLWTLLGLDTSRHSDAIFSPNQDLADSNIKGYSPNIVHCPKRLTWVTKFLTVFNPSESIYTLYTGWTFYRRRPLVKWRCSETDGPDWSFKSKQEWVFLEPEWIWWWQTLPHFGRLQQILRDAHKRCLKRRREVFWKAKDFCSLWIDVGGIYFQSKRRCS